MKKSKTIFCVLLIFTILLSDTSNNVFAKICRSNDDIILKAETLVDENGVNLYWNINNPTQPFNFKIMKKRNNESEYYPLGVEENKDKINILNLYPEKHLSTSTIPIDSSYTTWDGEYITGLPQSARLKRWMEEPNIENSKGYGKGLIEVIPLSIEQFNLEPSIFLFKDGNKYFINHNGEQIKVDAIMIGSWDNPRTYNFNEASINVLDNYIKDLGAVIFGHDSLHHNNGLKKFSQYMDVEAQNPQTENGKQLVYSGKVITPMKKGVILEKPWEINTSQLSIPLSHTYMQVIKKENVWIEFINSNGESIDANSISKLVEYDGYTNNHYLSIKNNLALIQTGHSNGKATSDEQKIIANTLFYMTQVSSTEGTTFKDVLGQDVNSPEKPIISNVVIDINNNKLKFKGDESKDVGTDYSYYIEATGQNNDVVINSNIVTVNIKKGLEGYSYVIDTNPNTIPDNEIDIESIVNDTEIVFKLSDMKQYYLHIKAIDGAGNFSETTHAKILSDSYELAIDAMSIVEDSPNFNNIKMARQTINNLPESYFKEELQNRLNTIYLNISFDKKNSTSNLDLYINSENILQMSLDTNSITFEDFSGVEDLAKENVVNISINSSLPYSLNAYLPNEMQNSDKSNIMDKSILNIKENSELTYQTFANTSEKLILKDNNPAGNDINHGIDIKLAGNIAHEKNIYKTTIKFEAQQK